MRSDSSPGLASGVATLILACACGNLSNEDIAFVEAIPQKQQLHVQVPQGATSQNLCAIGPADIFTSAKTPGVSTNAGARAIVALVDAIRTVTPTSRGEDSRTWGPFADKDHPDVRIKVVMVRELDATLTPGRWIYTIAGGKAAGPFLPVLGGGFLGAQAR